MEADPKARLPLPYRTKAKRCFEDRQRRQESNGDMRDDEQNNTLLKTKRLQSKPIFKISFRT
jgi:hypothetical protein